MKSMNHELIEAIIRLYRELPESTPELAASRVAVLVELELEKLEQSGKKINRETFLAAIKQSLEEHKKAA